MKNRKKGSTLKIDRKQVVFGLRDNQSENEEEPSDNSYSYRLLIYKFLDPMA